MTALDLDVIREDAEWSSKRMNTTDVAYKVATVHVPALVAEVERLRDLPVLAAQIEAALIISGWAEEPAIPRHWVTKWARVAAQAIQPKPEPSGSSSTGGQL